MVCGHVFISIGLLIDNLGVLSEEYGFNRVHDQYEYREGTF